MQERYLSGTVTAVNETEKAFCCTFDWTEGSGYAGRQMWIPKSVIDEDDHIAIADAFTGDEIEIAIAEWWLLENG